MKKSFADIYDLLTKDVKYNIWAKFLKRYIKNEGKILDIGCGTGNILLQFNGYDITGIDISDKMLEIASSKVNCRLIEMDITKNYLDEKFKYIMCNFDTVNYFSGYDDFENFVVNCSKMQDSGYLIFDLVEHEIFDEMFDEDNIFVDREINYASVWNYEYIDDNNVQIDIDIYLKEDNRLYKFNEKYIKYIYDTQKVINILEKYGYKLYDTARNPKFGNSRLYIIAKK